MPDKDINDEPTRGRTQFKPGNKLAKGGYRAGSGRKPKGAKTAAEIIRDMFGKNAERVGDRYFRRALGKNADRILCHAIDKILPNEQTQIPVISINFNQYTLQLPSAPVSSTVLAGNGQRRQASIEDLASAERQGQDGFEFSNFKDVSGK